MSYNVVFIKTGDSVPRPLHPGLTLGSDAPSEIPACNLDPDLSYTPEVLCKTTKTTNPILAAATQPIIAPRPVQPSVALHQSTRIVTPSDKVAAASGIEKISSLARVINAVKESAQRVQE